MTTRIGGGWLRHARRAAAMCLVCTPLIGGGWVAWKADPGAKSAAPASHVPPGPGDSKGGGGDIAAAIPSHVVFAYNDLGMHCMNSDFSELMVLPPFNNLHAQVVRRGVEPDIIDSAGDVTVGYVIPASTTAADKTNFWKYAQALLGATLPPNVGLTGHGLSGTLTPTPLRDWEATGIPVTNFEDSGRENAYPLATLTVKNESGAILAKTQAVVPVSTEMSCNLCHNTPGMSAASDILMRHDDLHNTNLSTQKPVLCAGCHSSNALGTPGVPGVASLSSAMHTAHATRMAGIPQAQICYTCHPGIRTTCQRDVHLANGVDCMDCHGDLATVGNPSRNPWLEEPRCGSCHTRQGFEFEQPNTLFRHSVGHKGIMCMSCHGSPHAITPTVTEVDNAQAIRKQGHAGVIDTCTVCHDPGPPGAFFHKVDD